MVYIRMPTVIPGRRHATVVAGARAAAGTHTAGPGRPRCPSSPAAIPETSTATPAG